MLGKQQIMNWQMNQTRAEEIEFWVWILDGRKGEIILCVEMDEWIKLYTFCFGFFFEWYRGEFLV